jgi:hypothetical protein
MIRHSSSYHNNSDLYLDHPVYKSMNMSFTSLKRVSGLEGVPFLQDMDGGNFVLNCEGRFCSALPLAEDPRLLEGDHQAKSLHFGCWDL